MRSITIGARFQQPALIRSRLPAARWTQQVVPYSVTGNRSWTVVFPDFQTFQLSRRHVVNQCCDIFISPYRINSGWTLGLCSNQTWDPLKSFRVYKPQSKLWSSPLPPSSPSSPSSPRVWLPAFSIVRIIIVLYYSNNQTDRTTYVFRRRARCTSMFIYGRETS